ncbi:MAG: CoA transferase, partial [Chloroflexi bacterium]|nr:CoA transferase [Chloroflexota bacterium]
LVVTSDVVVCNLGGDQLERWGIGEPRIRALNPRAIVVNMPSMESHGPRSNWRGFGDMFVAVAGLKSVSGHPGEPPLPWGHQYADFSSNPFHAAIAVMAALHERERSGDGQFIELSQYESTVALMGPSVLALGATGQAPRPPGNADPEAAPHNFYRCAGEDAWCAIAVFTDEQWRALATFSGLPALADPAYASAAGRRSALAAIDEAVEGWTRRWDRQTLAAELQTRGIPAGPYQTVPEMVQDDPTLGRHHFVEVEHPVGRSFVVHGNPIAARRSPPAVRRAPLIGEHTFEVLIEVLGLDPAEIAELAAAGALE